MAGKLLLGLLLCGGVAAEDCTANIAQVETPEKTSFTLTGLPGKHKPVETGLAPKPMPLANAYKKAIKTMLGMDDPDATPSCNLNKIVITKVRAATTRILETPPPNYPYSRHPAPSQCPN